MCQWAPRHHHHCCCFPPLLQTLILIWRAGNLLLRNKNSRAFNKCSSCMTEWAMCFKEACHSISLYGHSNFQCIRSPRFTFSSETVLTIPMSTKPVWMGIVWRWSKFWPYQHFSLLSELPLKATNQGKLLCLGPKVVALIISLPGYFSSWNLNVVF